MTASTELLNKHSRKWGALQAAPTPLFLHSLMLKWFLVMMWTYNCITWENVGIRRMSKIYQCLSFGWLRFPDQIVLLNSAAAAKSLQSCPTLCDPTDGSPPGSSIPGILQARTLEWAAISFSNAWKWKVKVKSLSCVQLFATPWTVAYQAPPSLGFSRQEYWSGLPLPSPFKQCRVMFFRPFETKYIGFMVISGV